MKVLVFLGLLSIIQFSWSLDVDIDAVFDALDDCDVSLGDFQCLEEYAFNLMDDMDARMDIDLEAVQSVLEGCGFTVDEDSLECLKGFSPEYWPAFAFNATVYEQW